MKNDYESLSHTREIHMPLHSWTVKKRPFCDTIWSELQSFFLELLTARNGRSVAPLIHHIPKLNVTASTGILNLGIWKPCLLIFFSMLEEVVASRGVLLKMTVCLLETHFPIPVNAARAPRLYSHEKCSRCPILYRRVNNSVQISLYHWFFTLVYLILE